MSVRTSLPEKKLAKALDRVQRAQTRVIEVYPGDSGARHVMDMFADELRTEMKHVGIQSLDGAKDITVRHPGAWSTR